MVLWNELRKVFSKKMLFLLATICTLNIVLMVIGERRKGIYFDTQNYKELYRDEAMNGDVEEALSHIEALAAETEENDYKRHLLFEYIRTELGAVKGYRDYIDGITVYADKLANLSIFNSGDQFSNKNMEKIAEVYVSLPEINTEAGPQRGIEMVLDNPGGTVLAFLFAVFVCVSVVIREREIGSLVLTRTTFLGYFKHGVAKLSCCCVASTLSVIFIELSGWITAEAMYGLGDISRPIQSIPDFRTCVFPCSVIEFAVIQTIFKVLYVSAIINLVFFAVCVSSSYLKLIVIFAVVFGSEGIMYAQISGNSTLSFLKYFNIYCGMDSDRLFGDYININAFGNPIWLLPVVIGFVIMLFVLFSCLGVWGYYGMDVMPQGKLKLSLKVLPEKTVSLFVHELYKFFFCEKVAFIIIAFAVLRILTFSPVNEVFKNREEMYYKQYMMKLEGLYGKDKEEFIEREKIEYEELSKKAIEAMTSTEDVVVLSLISAKYQDESKKYTALNMVESHAEYLRVNDGAFVYDLGYRILTGDERGKRENNILWIMVNLVMTACMVFLIAPDYQTGVDRIIRSTANGRGCLFIKRELIGTCTLAILFIICYIPFTVSVLDAYGNMGISYPACSLESLSWCPVWVSIRGYIIMLDIFRYVMLWVEMNIMFVISTRTKSIIYTIASGIVLFVIPSIIIS